MPWPLSTVTVLETTTVLPGVLWLLLRRAKAVLGRTGALSWRGPAAVEAREEEREAGRDDVFEARELGRLSLRAARCACVARDAGRRLPVSGVAVAGRALLRLPMPP